MTLVPFGDRMLRAWLLLVLLFQLASAEQPAFRLFTTEDGLVRNWIERIRRDSRGYLWFCTVEGISIFDGSRFTNFTVRDGLPNRAVHDLLESSTGDYWIATGNGVSRFRPIARPGGGHFENFQVSPIAGANQVHSIIEDAQHRLWLATEGGLFRGQPASGTISFEDVPLAAGRAIGKAPVPPSALSAVVEDARHSIWAGGRDGVYLLPPDGSIQHFGVKQGVPEGVRAMLLDRGTLWIGSQELAGLDVTAERPAVIAHYSTANGNPLNVAALYRNPGNGDLWVGSFGLLRFRPGAAPKDRFQAFPSSPVLARYNILAIGSDSASNVWAGVSTLGAVRILSDPSESYSEADGLEAPGVVGLMEDRNGKTYALTGAGHVLNELVAGRFEPRPRRQPPGLTDMGWGQGPVALQDRLGEWWVASADGLLNYSATDDARKLAAIEPHLYTHRDGLPDGTILRLFEDSRGDLWVGTSAGLGQREHASGKWISFPPHDPVHSITEDHSGAVWVGFAGPHLLRIRSGKCDDIQDGLPDGFLNALLVDHPGRLWIGSSQAGLARIDDPAAERPRIQRPPIAGLSSDHVFSLAEDLLGRLYIAGGHGVDRLDPASGAIRHFTEANLLPPGETERLYRDRNGSIWFASNFGLARYDPRSDPQPPAHAPLLRRVSIGSQDYPLSVLGVESLSGLELGPRDSHVEIDYRAIQFNTTQPLRYQYRLLGASDLWSPPSDQQSVRFANLASGRYIFEVRSVGENGESSAPAVLSFHLLPPIWGRGWFLAAAFALVAATAVALHRYRLKHAVMVERVRTRLATDLHDDLGAGLAEIAILSEVARRSPGGAEPVLDQVAKRARGLRSTLGDIVWTVDPRKDRLDHLVHRMRETALNMLESEGSRVHFTAPPEASFQNAELPPDLRRHLLLFFKEAVANIARHAAASEVDLELIAVDSELRLRIHDNGRGFDTASPPEGQGLSSLRYRAAEMHAGVRIDSIPGGGTKIELRVPLGKPSARPASDWFRSR
jgi:signal transduction histidine kinase/ligand-binding sensor domain-containing protein